MVNGEKYESANVAIAEGLFAIARALRALGNGNAATEMGAIENLSKQVNEGFVYLAETLSNGMWREK